MTLWPSQERRSGETPHGCQGRGTAGHDEDAPHLQQRRRDEKPDGALGDAAHTSSGAGGRPSIRTRYQVDPARDPCAGSRGALVKLRRQYGLLKKSRTLPERPCRETASPAFSAPGAGFVEGSLSTDPGSGEGMVWG